MGLTEDRGIPDGAPDTSEASWLDRLSGAVRRLPFPDVLTYGLFGAAIYAFEVAVQWIVEGVPGGAFSAAIPMALLIPGIPFLVGRFNEAARSAVARLPDETLDPRFATTLTDRLTSVPGRWALTAGLATVAILYVRIGLGGLGFTRPVEELLPTVGLGISPPAVIVAVLTLTVVAVLIVTFVLKVAYTAYWIDRIGRSFVNVDVHRLDPMYGFSRLSAAMAVSLVVPVVLVGITVPPAARDPVGIALGIAVIALAGFVFVWPLNGLHRRIVAEKADHLAATTARIRRARAALHHAVDTEDLPSMDPLQKAISGLEIDQRMLDAIPTWPWEPETLRWVAGALLFPVALFAAQLIITRVVQ